MKFPERYRIQSKGYESREGDEYGIFAVPMPKGRTLRIIATSGHPDIVPWDHVSVSLPDRCPTWEEMDHVKRLFWDDNEAVMQLHPPRSQWVNNHPYCLHLWRPLDGCIPLPPSWTVGYPSLNGKLAI